MTENRSAQDILRNAARMTLDDSFVFHCDASADCFTCCCRDVSIVLTPYDIIRMKHALRLDSSEFLARYTFSPFSKEQKIPVVLLKMATEAKTCPFVTAKGCSIYADRPWACRMYPLGLAEPDRPTSTERAFYFTLREELCHGHGVGRALTVREWLESQGIEEYDMMAASFKELMLHPFWNRHEPLTPPQIEMYYMACYDLDRFRRFVFETRFLGLFEIDEARVEAMRGDDLELLDFAMQWIRFSLFQDRTMKINPSVTAAGSRSESATGRNIYG